jgi:hypothetical protein
MVSLDEKKKDSASPHDLTIPPDGHNSRPTATPD